MYWESTSISVSFEKGEVIQLQEYLCADSQTCHRLFVTNMLSFTDNSSICHFVLSCKKDIHVCLNYGAGTGWEDTIVWKEPIRYSLFVMLLTFVH